MGDSNNSWGELAKHDDELADVFDSYQRIPDEGTSPAIDAFVERKRISIRALVRLGARLADHSVLAFGFPGGIKFRDVVTDRRWSYAGSDWHALKIVPAGREPARRVIVAEGETDAAWLVDRLVDCDVAVLPAGADPRPHAKSYAEQLSGYELVLLGQDDDRAGDEGAAQLAELLPQAQRFTPPANDWCASDELPPLPEPVELDRAGGLIFENLRALLDGDTRPPDLMVDSLLYTEGVHWLSGHPGCGKTTLAMHAALLVMADDIDGPPRHVVWLDYEGGPRGTVRRLLDMGVPTGLILERFHYAGWPSDAAQYFGDIAARWPGALIVLDSASKALQMAALDENSPGDVTKWVAPIVRACKTHALPVVVIDHVTKNATAGARYSRGAGSKLADSDVAWYIEAETKFNRETKGRIRCTLQKDREGYMPYDAWYAVGDGQGGLTVEQIPAPSKEDDDATPPDAEPAI